LQDNNEEDMQIPFKRFFTKKKVSQSIEKSYTSAEVENIYTKAAQWNDWDSSKAIEEGYKSAVPVYACVKKRMDSIASIPLVVEVKSGDEWEAQPNHPLQMLLDNPNPEMTTSTLTKLMVAHLDLAGNAYWMKVKAGAGNTTKELWPTLPQHVSVSGSQQRLVEYYTVGVEQKRVSEDDMCHFKFIDPSSLIFGQAPLKAAGKAVDIDNAGQAWQKVSMQNRGVPDLHVSYENPDMTPEQYEQAKDAAKKNTGPGEARAPWVTSKATIKQLSMSPVEMDFMETRRFTREDICSAYGVPSSLIAEMGNVNLANAETARRAFWQDTIVPLMDEITDALNMCLASEYGADVRISYDLSNIPALQENYSEKLTNAKTMWSMGVPFNVVNQRLELGLDDIDGGDIGYIPTGVIPAIFDFDTEVDEEAKKAVFNQLIEKHNG